MAHSIDNCPDVVCLNCKLVGHPHWRCDEQENTKLTEKKQAKITKITKITKIYQHNRFDVLELDDSDLSDQSDVEEKPVELNNLKILQDLRYCTLPWGNLDK